MKRLFCFLLTLCRTKFWGDVTIKLKDGEWTGQVVLNQSLKQESMPPVTPESERELHKVLMS